jgi:hypothetical protein
MPMKLVTAGRWLSAPLLICSMLSGVVISNAVLAGTASASSCPYGPNLYAGGTDGAGTKYGAQGVITAHSESVPSKSMYFTDEAVHAIGTPSGLEVGWYVGYGTQTGTYVTTPHAYATLNGPSEVDGPSVPTTSSYWYTAWWSGYTEHYRVDKSVNGTVYWNGTIRGTTIGPGTIVAMGEVNSTVLPMGPSTLSSLQHLNSNGTWASWSGTTTCADSPYKVSGSGTSVSNS